MDNKIKVIFPNISSNERLARSVVSAFVLDIDPTTEALSELKTAVSEAVTNAIIHAYPDCDGEIEMSCEADKNTVYITVSDKGRGIENVEQAMQPMFTESDSLERSGMGFTVMEAFCDEIKVTSAVNDGTTVRLKKVFNENE